MLFQDDIIKFVFFFINIKKAATKKKEILSTNIVY